MKEDYFAKKATRIRQRIKVLTNMPIFQEEIKRLRKKWNIPLNGLETDQDLENWKIQLEVATDDYDEREWPKCLDEIKKLRQAGKHIEIDEKRKEYQSKRPLIEFNDDIWSVVREYRLSQRWNSGIKHYLLTNSTENWGIANGVSIVTTWANGMKLLSLELDGETTLIDIKHMWPWVKRMQKGLLSKQFDKFQPIRNFERDKRTYELEQDGKTLEEIAEAINVEFDNALVEGEVKQIIKRHKKRLNIN